MSVVLELDAVTKTYGTEPPVSALDGVSFSVQEGELVAIVGPSGSGKSTLLHLMGTLDRPSSGVVRITGLDSAQLSDRELEVLRLLAAGRPITAISRQLGLSPKTVTTYRARLLHKLRMRSNAELTFYATQHGLISPAALRATL